MGSHEPVPQHNTSRSLSATTENAPAGRAPSHAADWVENYINPTKARRTRTPTEAIVQGSSALVVPGLVTATECSCLIGEAKAAATKLLETADETCDSDETCDPSASSGSCDRTRVRLPVLTAFGEDGQALCDQL